MTNDGISLKYLGLDLTATDKKIEEAIVKRAALLRTEISRGERNGTQATFEFTKHCVGARRWAKAQADFNASRPTPATTKPQAAAALALVACNACANEISPAASACPKCGHPQFVKTPALATKPKTGDTHNALTEPIGKGQVAFTLIAATAFILWYANQGSSTGHQNNSGYWYGAKSSCQDAVRARLKSPSTANFGPIDEYGHSTTNEVREIRGSVDSQNGFGAMLRAQYTCSISGQSVTAVDVR